MRSPSLRPRHQSQRLEGATWLSRIEERQKAAAVSSGHSNDAVPFVYFSMFEPWEDTHCHFPSGILTQVSVQRE